MAGSGGNEYARRLGAEIRTRRVTRGMSLRALAQELGLSGHGTLVDYEHGRRIPPEDLVIGLERVFQISDGALRNLRDKALAERADQQADLLLTTPDRTTPGEPEQASLAESTPPTGAPGKQGSPAGRRRGQRWLLVAAATAVVVIGAVVGIWRVTATPASSAPPARSPAAAGRTVVAGWGMCWGAPVGRIQPTDAVTYLGAKSLQVTVTKPNEVGDLAVCTHHGLSSLRPGTRVTVDVQASAPTAGDGLGFFVYDSHYTPTWAPETPKGDHVALSVGTDWQTFVWTVPTVDKVITIGVEVYSVSDQPLIVWLGEVTW